MRTILKQFINSIHEENKRIEVKKINIWITNLKIDPDKMSTSVESIEQNCKHLTDISQQFLQVVLNSIDQFPM